MGNFAIECKNGRTRPEFAAEVDINNIIKRFRNTGELPQLREGSYGDVSIVPTDFMARDAMVHDIHDQFAALPSQVRKSFKNDPVKWLEAIHAQKASAEADIAKQLEDEENGIITPQAAPPEQAQGVNEAVPATTPA